MPAQRLSQAGIGVMAHGRFVAALRQTNGFNRLGPCIPVCVGSQGRLLMPFLPGEVRT